MTRKKRDKNAIIWMLVLALCMSGMVHLGPVQAKESTQEERDAKGPAFSGTCGEDVFWNIEDAGSGQVLIISGKGKISDSDVVNGSIWKDFSGTVTEIVIESGITAIGKCAFYAMDHLKSVRISDTVFEIGDFAFSQCEALEAVTLPEGVEILGYSAFSDCSSLATVSLPGSLRKMKGYEFRNCTSLKNMEIPEGIEDIGQTFYGCTGLENIFLPSTLKKIGSGTFYECLNLKQVSVHEDNESLFSDKKGLYQTDLAGSTLICAFPSGTGEFRLGPEVRALEREAFYSSGLSKVVIPGSVTTIPSNCFSGKASSETGLEVVLESGVLEIEYDAFTHTNLTSVTIPRSVFQISDTAFSSRKKPKIKCFEGSAAHRYAEEKGIPFSLLEEEGGITVSLDAREGSVSQADITVWPGGPYGELPEPEKEGWTFAGWYEEDGTLITQGSMVKQEDCQLFAKWTQGEVFQGTCGPGVEWLLDSGEGVLRLSGTGRVTSTPALGDAGSLAKSLIAEEGITSLDNGWGLDANQDTYPKVGFSGTRIRNVSLPDTLREIGDAFSDCRYLEEIEIPSGVTRVGLLKGDESLRRVVLSDTVDNFPKTLFYGCTSLNKVEVSSGNPKYSADDFAIYSERGTCIDLFYASGETSFVVPEQVKKIGLNCFNDDSILLEELTIPGAAEVFEDRAVRDQILINCYKDSPAHEYAKSSHLFRLLDTQEGTLYFEAGESAMPEAERVLTVGSSIGRLPEPTKNAESFAGWYTQPDGGVRITERTVFLETATVYGRWNTQGNRIVLDAAGGLLPGGLEKDYLFVQEESGLGLLPVPSRTGYTFKGWFTQETDGEQVKEGEAAKIDVLYAHWIHRNSYVTWLSANGGWTSEEGISWFEGEPFGTLPTPVRDYYIFDGWWTQREGGNEITAETIAPAIEDAPERLYAHWTEAKEIYEVIFDTNGGKAETGSKKVVYGKPYGTLPSAVREGYRFAGWYTSRTGGTRVLSSHLVGAASGQTLYARWEGLSYQVKFDPNGGRTGIISKQVRNGDTYGSLPEPVREGYDFAGWYDAKSGGNRITSASRVDLLADQTLYASWIQKQQDVYELDTLTYSFSNSQRAFQYPDYYRIPLARYQQMFGTSSLASRYYERNGKWGGSCFGMSTTSSMLATSNNGLSPDLFRNARKVSQLKVKDRSPALNMDVTSMIELMQISQYTGAISREDSASLNNLDSLCREVSKVGITQKPVSIGVYFQDKGHAVLGYNFEEIDSVTGRIYVYDCNRPGKTRYITVRKNQAGSYTDPGYLINDLYPVDRISYVTYDTYYRVWTNRGVLENINMLYLNTKNAEIYDEEGEKVASLEDGELITESQDILLVEPVGMTFEEDSLDQEDCLIYLPKARYTVKNTDESVSEFQADVANVNLGAEVRTTSDEITFELDDDAELADISVEADQGERYIINLTSSSDQDNRSLEMDGVSQGEEVSLCLNQGDIALSGERSTLQVDGEQHYYAEITAKAGNGGSISQEGTAAYLNGSFQEYIVTPDKGYQIKDVLVDGESIGAVGRYSFTDIRYPHTIYAEFEKAPAQPDKPVKPGKPSEPSRPAPSPVPSLAVPALKAVSAGYNEVSLKWNRVSGADGYQLEYSRSKTKDYALLNTLTGDKTSCKAEKLTPGKKYYFRLRAYKKSGGKVYYSGYSKTAGVTPVPKVPTGIKLKKKGPSKVRIKWKPVKGASGYEILYSTSKKFRGTKKRVSVKGAKASVKTFSIKKGKKGYCKIRAYRSVSGKKMYGSYSKVKQFR